MTEAAKTNQPQLPTPLSIREREAWFKAGVNALAVRLGVGALIGGGALSAVADMFGLLDFGRTFSLCAAFAVMTAGVSFWLDIHARDTASRGGVDVDRF